MNNDEMWVIYRDMINAIGERRKVTEPAAIGITVDETMQIAASVHASIVGAVNFRPLWPELFYKLDQLMVALKGEMFNVPDMSYAIFNYGLARDVILHIISCVSKYKLDWKEIDACRSMAWVMTFEQREGKS
jgi:hypothetical protein